MDIGFFSRQIRNLPGPWSMYNNNVLVSDGTVASYFNITTPIDSTTGFAQWIFQSDTNASWAYINDVSNGSGTTSLCADGWRNVINARAGHYLVLDEISLRLTVTHRRIYP